MIKKVQSLSQESWLMLIIPVVEKLKQEDHFEFQDQIEEEGTNFVVLIHLTATSIFYVIHSFVILRAFNT